MRSLAPATSIALPAVLPPACGDRLPTVSTVTEVNDTIPWRRLTVRCATLLLVLLAACHTPEGPSGTASLSGTVRSADPSAPLAGVTITIGEKNATSDADGLFELTDVQTGAVTVRAERPGYQPAEAAVTLAEGSNSHDFALAALEIYLLGSQAVYVPAGGGPLRGAIVVLGGPNTSGFVTGETIAQQPDASGLEARLQAVGASLRAFARSEHVALLGSSRAPFENSVTSDELLFTSLLTAGELSGRPELANAPVLMYGMSGGAREAAGLVSRNPARVVGLLGWVPAGVTALTAPDALAVPTLIIQAEDDGNFNVTIQTQFSEHRSRGGLWALVIEPEVEHASATSAASNTGIGWMRTVLTLRLPDTPGGPLVALAQASGWLGNQVTGEIASWDSYPGARTSASWLPSESAALSWKALGTSGAAQ